MIGDWLYIAQFSLVGAMLLLAAIGFWVAAALPGMDRWSKRFFMCFFAILALCVGAYFVDAMVYGDPDLLLHEMIASLLESLLPSILIIMSTVYLLHCCGEDWRKSALFWTAFTAWIAFLVILGIAQFTTAIYYYTPDAQFATGPLYPLGMMPPIAILIINLVGVLRRRDKLSKKRYLSFLAFIIPLMVALIIQSFYYSFLIANMGITISALSMFVFVVLDQVEQYTNLQRETARQRSKILVLRMRPHFIHNAMTSIYYLCDQDPKKAQQVTLDFNTYLRKNLTAIAKEDTIPFTEELEHTRAYLAVEQAQFEDKLVVDYDTPHTRFHVPPLTLQPLAENAVKHGMSSHTVPLRVSIRTRKTESGSEIVVEDNGPGFDPSLANEPQTTLSNIRQRLELMCNGSLGITPREGGGTVAKVTIP